MPRTLQGLGLHAQWAVDIRDVYTQCTQHILDAYTGGSGSTSGGGDGADIRRVVTDQQAQITALQEQLATLTAANAALTQQLATAQRQSASSSRADSQADAVPVRGDL